MNLGVSIVYWKPLPFPNLRKIHVEKCPNLEKLRLDSQSANGNYMSLVAEQSWIEELEWEDEATKQQFSSMISYLNKSKWIWIWYKQNNWCFFLFIFLLSFLITTHLTPSEFCNFFFFVCLTYPCFLLLSCESMWRRKPW